MSKRPDRSKLYAREAARRALQPYSATQAALVERDVPAVDPVAVAGDGRQERYVPNLGPVPRSSVFAPGGLAHEALARGRAGSLLRLRRNVAYRVELDAEISELVAGARSAGATWAEIAGVAGLSRDGAVSRWGRRRPGTP